MPRIRSMVALLMALAWLPAGSLCLIESTGLIAKGDCCEEEGVPPVSPGTGCDEPCGVLAAGNYLVQQDLLVLFAPPSESPALQLPVVPEMQMPFGRGGDSAMARPDLIAGWHFLLRTALSPRAPSFPS